MIECRIARHFISSRSLCIIINPVRPPKIAETFVQNLKSFLFIYIVLCCNRSMTLCNCRFFDVIKSKKHSWNVSKNAPRRPRGRNISHLVVANTDLICAASGNIHHSTCPFILEYLYTVSQSWSFKIVCHLSALAVKWLLGSLADLTIQTEEHYQR